MLQEDPRVRLESENQRLLRDKMRLELENDCLANKYVSCEVALRRNIDQVSCSVTDEEHSTFSTWKIFNHAL